MIYDESENQQPVQEEVEKEVKAPVVERNISSTPINNPISEPILSMSGTGSFDQAIFDKLSKAIELNNLKSCII